MILILASFAFAIPQELSERDPKPPTDAQHVADLGAERARLVDEMAADQTRIDQIDGELARLTTLSVVSESVAPPPPVSHARITGVIVDAGPADQISSVLYVSATGPFQACQAGITFNVAGKFTLRDGVVTSDSFAIAPGALHPPTLDTACFDTAMRALAFGHWRGTSNVNFIFE